MCVRACTFHNLSKLFTAVSVLWYWSFSTSVTYKVKKKMKKKKERKWSVIQTPLLNWADTSPSGRIQVWGEKYVWWVIENHGEHLCLWFAGAPAGCVQGAPLFLHMDVLSFQPQPAVWQPAVCGELHRHIHTHSILWAWPLPGVPHTCARWDICYTDTTPRQSSACARVWFKAPIMWSLILIGSTEGDGTM